MNTSRAALATWIGLALAGIGIVAPILWERYKDTSSLEVQQLASAVVVGSLDGVDELKITYRDEPVPRVSRLDVFVTNTGRRPIRGADVVSPLRLSAPAAGRILDVRVQKVIPSDLEITGTLEAEGKHASFLFPLLNPGDGATVTLLLAGRSDVSVSGRIAGVRDVRMIDKRADATGVWRRLHAGVWVVIAFVSLGIVAVLALVWHLGAETQIAAMWKAGIVTFDASTPGEFLNRIAPYLPAKSADFADVIKKMKALAPDVPLTDESRDATNQFIRAKMTKVDLYGPLALFSILTIIGIWYILAKLAS